MTKRQKYTKKFERLAFTLISWMGTPWSIIAHTFVFLGFLLSLILGENPEQVMLILTTAVSLEAIYLSLFIQMTVNKNTESLDKVEDDIDQAQEDIEDLSEDVEEIQKDYDQDQEVGLSIEKQQIETLNKIIGELNNIKGELTKIKTSTPS